MPPYDSASQERGPLILKTLRSRKCCGTDFTRHKDYSILGSILGPILESLINLELTNLLTKSS